MMKSTTQLLQQLEKQIETITLQCKGIELKETDELRFDQHLFTPSSIPERQTSLSYYLKEIGRNFQYLKQAIDYNQSEKIEYLTEKLVNQIIAINRELATQDLRKAKPQIKHESLHEKHSRYLDYQRRLNNMKNEIEQELEQSITGSPLEQQKIQKQLAALEGRIFRCNQAITKLEKDIESDIVTN